MKHPKIIIPVLFLIFFSSCENGREIDKQKPEIDISFSGAFPKSCDTIYFGETFYLKVLLSDNAELGSYSVDIHHNFDHHSHSTEVDKCNPDPEKKPVNPFVFIRDYSIPAGLKAYETNVAIQIPSKDDAGVFDEGDYHFYINLTDKEGWSSPVGLSIKILYRD